MRGESGSRPGKRPLRALSAAEKIDAIQRVHEGESKASVARDIGVPESTLRGWCKSEHKIRGMARNSCTPDSEAHSPASGSGIINNVNNSSSLASHNSEDETSHVNKRQKLSDPDKSIIPKNNIEHLEIEKLAKIDGQSNKIDYAALMASVAAMKPEGGGSLLLQQLGLLSTATNAIASKNLLQIPATGGGGAGTQSGAVVGLVENGLQYTRSAGTSKRQQQQPQQSTSAAAPTQIDRVEKSGSRNILPPAAEAPFTPAPASPRKTNDGSQHQSVTGHSSNSNNNNSNNNCKVKKKENDYIDLNPANPAPTFGSRIDEALWLWLTQQQQLLGQQSAMFNPGVNQDLGGSWFWKWYKQYGFAPAAPTPAASGPNISTVAKKSPTKARAMLDNVLAGNNNNNDRNHNENIKRNSSTTTTTANTTAMTNNCHQDDNSSSESDVQLTAEEAVSHGDKFLKWLDKCSEPSVSRMQIMQFRYLLDNLKNCRKPNSGLKRSRK